VIDTTYGRCDIINATLLQKYHSLWPVGPPSLKNKKNKV